MHSSFVAFALILFGRHTITATPVTPKTSPIAASFPITTLREFGIHSSITLARKDIPAILGARQDSPATLLLCPSANCVSCSVVDLDQSESKAMCYGTGKELSSVAISQPSNEGLSFAIAVGTPTCADFEQIPVVNTCFNVK